jgi:hypothetical protein
VIQRNIIKIIYPNPRLLGQCPNMRFLNRYVPTNADETPAQYRNTP